MIVACLAGVSAEINHQKKNHPMPNAPVNITQWVFAGDKRGFVVTRDRLVCYELNKPTQPSTLRGMVKWASAFGMSDINKFPRWIPSRLAGSKGWRPLGDKSSFYLTWNKIDKE